MAEPTTFYPDLMNERLTEEEAELFRDSRRRTRRRHRDMFVGGPFPWPQFKLVAQLPGKAIVVWQLIHHQRRLKRRPVITLPKDMLEDCGISRSANKRALAALEQVGLILVIRGKGRSVRISLVELLEDDD